MLGIRRYRDTAIDLWCGSSSSFVADLHVSHLSDQLDRAKSRRHIAIGVYEVEHRPSAEQLGELMISIRQFVEDRLSESIVAKRITLIADDLSHYETLQAYLYQYFDEAPCH